MADTDIEQPRNKKYVTMRRWFFPILFCPLLFFCSCSEEESSSSLIQRPNILLIVADDMGYGDIGCFGGDIATPNLDALAANGIRFTRFHTAPMCAPTRAMLLSGNDNHIAGMGLQGRVTTTFGYEGQLTDRIIPVPALLREAGYRTSMAGKWHLGTNPEANPHQKGFDHSFVMLQGAGNHYSARSALNGGLSDYTEDGDSVTWPEGAYSTELYTDKLIEYIGQQEENDQPFFAFAAYTSPHWPLQVDTAHWHKYRGAYNDGYEALRQRRLQSLKKAGIIPEEATLPALHRRVKPWDSLTVEEQRIEARKMELYAGMVDNLDQQIGRLIDHLKATRAYENTLIVFMSDNGAAHRDFIQTRPVLRDYYNDAYADMGSPQSYISYGPQWAEAGSAPFRYFKDYATEGGTNTTLIVSHPDIQGQNTIHHGFVSLLDLAPTFYQAGGIEYPDTFRGEEVYPLRGASMLPLLTGRTDQVHDDEYVFAVEHAGNAMVRKGDWKIVNHQKPFAPEHFELYYLPDDPGEQTDLRHQEPEKYRELLREWDAYVEETGVQIPPPRMED